MKKIGIIIIILLLIYTACIIGINLIRNNYTVGYRDTDNDGEKDDPVASAEISSVEAGVETNICACDSYVGVVVNVIAAAIIKPTSVLAPMMMRF